MSTQPPALSFWDRSPPLAAAAAARVANTPLDLVPDVKATKDTIPTLKLASGDELVGVPMILKYVARLAPSSGLYGSDALGACQVDYWLEYASQVVSGPNFEAICKSIDQYLAMRSFLVGYTLTIADLMIWGQLQASPLWKKTKSSVPHLARLFDFISALPEAVASLDALDSKKNKPASMDTGATQKGGSADAGGSFDIGLGEEYMGRVVTRFPPEPSGYLHIGHAKAALLNQYFADTYKGKLIVRFDDTNPSKEKDEFVENILDDIKRIGLTYDRLTYTSDYFKELEDIGGRLIKAGLMYADDTPVEQMRDERTKGIESKCRNRPAEETLRIFEEMKKGSEEGLKHALRFKMDMQEPNKCLRDPVAFRCNLTPHWRTGTRYKVYPTYDFACPFVDAYEGVTHALRTSEYNDRNPQFQWVLRMIQQVWPGLPNVQIWEYARLNFVNTLLSKRKLTWFVETGRVDGWTDARMPTVQGILRRGLRMEALREFILSQGASRNITYQEWDKIWTINKKLIDPVAPRHTAIEAKQAVRVTLTNPPAETELVTVAKHKKYPPAGSKVLVRGGVLLLDQADAQAVAEGEEVTLMDWGNAIVKVVEKDASGAVTAISAELNLAGDVKKTKLKLTWLTHSDELVELVLVDFDYLINKKKVEEDDDFMSLVNEQTRFDTPALGDINMRSLQKGDVIQLERKGYYIVDEPLVKAGKPIVLFNIPDGRTKPTPGKQA